MNHILPQFCSRYHEVGATFVDAFTAPIHPSVWVLWCNPPFSIMGRVILWLRQGGFTAYVVAPHGPRWAEKAWWLPLMDMSRASVTLPQDAFTSVARAHQEGYHGVPYDIKVHFCPPM